MFSVLATFHGEMTFVEVVTKKSALQNVLFRMTTQTPQNYITLCIQIASAGVALPARPWSSCSPPGVLLLQLVNVLGYSAVSWLTWFEERWMPALLPLSHWLTRTIPIGRYRFLSDDWSHVQPQQWFQSNPNCDSLGFFTDLHVETEHWRNLSVGNGAELGGCSCTE